MSKENEVAYLSNIVKVLEISPTEVEAFHLKKPFAAENPWHYLIDMGQILSILPPPPARLLDLGAGSGWTSEMFARCGYSVLGLDIAPDMIALAQRRTCPDLELEFAVHDYEESLDLGLFDIVVIYDALHHALDEGKVITNVFHCLKPGGIFVTAEPGIGHSTSPGSLYAMEKFGTTEKDMEYSRQARLMHEAGFATRQYIRLSHLPLERVENGIGAEKQLRRSSTLIADTLADASSIVVAIKTDPEFRQASVQLAQAQRLLWQIRSSRGYQLLRQVGRWQHLEDQIQSMITAPEPEDLDGLQQQLQGVRQWLLDLQRNLEYRLLRRLGHWKWFDHEMQAVFPNE